MAVNFALCHLADCIRIVLHFLFLLSLLFYSILAIKILGSYPIDGHIFAGTAARRDFIMPVSRVTTAKLQAKTCRQFAVSISKTEKETERRREKEREGKL